MSRKQDTRKRESRKRKFDPGLRDKVRRARSRTNPHVVITREEIMSVLRPDDAPGDGEDGQQERSATATDWAVYCLALIHEEIESKGRHGKRNTRGPGYRRMGYAKVSSRQLGKILRCSHSTVLRSLHRLTRLGLVSVHQAGARSVPVVVLHAGLDGDPLGAAVHPCTSGEEDGDGARQTQMVRQRTSHEVSQRTTPRSTVQSLNNHLSVVGHQPASPVVSFGFSDGDGVTDPQQPAAAARREAAEQPGGSAPGPPAAAAGEVGVPPSEDYEDELRLLLDTETYEEDDEPYPDDPEFEASYRALYGIDDPDEEEPGEEKPDEDDYTEEATPGREGRGIATPTPAEQAGRSLPVEETPAEPPGPAGAGQSPDRPRGRAGSLGADGAGLDWDLTWRSGGLRGPHGIDHVVRVAALRAKFADGQKGPVLWVTHHYRADRGARSGSVMIGRSYSVPASVVDAAYRGLAPQRDVIRSFQRARPGPALLFRANARAEEIAERAEDPKARVTEAGPGLLSHIADDLLGQAGLLGLQKGDELVDLLLRDFWQARAAELLGELAKGTTTPTDLATLSAQRTWADRQRRRAVEKKKKKAKAERLYAEAESRAADEEEERQRAADKTWLDGFVRQPEECERAEDARRAREAEEKARRTAEFVERQARLTQALRRQREDNRNPAGEEP